MFNKKKFEAWYNENVFDYRIEKNIDKLYTVLDDEIYYLRFVDNNATVYFCERDCLNSLLITNIEVTQIWSDNELLNPIIGHTRNYIYILECNLCLKPFPTLFIISRGEHGFNTTPIPLNLNKINSLSYEGDVIFLKDEFSCVEIDCNSLNGNGMKKKTRRNVHEYER